ncbi:MAG: B12-binding domain-containing radical SAM protein [Verrucomicrobia bacterium]|nr:B12-binding domain-containing radical SAM protein [Verrucomicrobiota bacterium]
MKKVLLVYPQAPVTFWSFTYALKFVRKKAALPPLGLLTVAAMLPEEWSKRLVDMNVSGLRDEDLAWADCVWISAMTIQRKSALEVIERCNKAGVTIIAGGPLFTCEPGQFHGIDHLVLNEAEVTLPPFLKDLAEGEAKPVYATSEFPDLALTPAPDWSLCDLKNYATMCVQYSRGCPYNCDFCNVTALLGRRVRRKTASQMIGELDALCDAGWKGGVFFVDDNFIGNRGQLKAELLPALIEWGRDHPHVRFNTEASINLADDPELMAMMVEARFDEVFIGIETPNEESLAECGKRQNQNRDLIESVHSIQRAGLEVQGGFIVGFDHDEPSVFRRQIDFIQKSGIVTAMVGLLQAPPGTRLFERMKSEGRLSSLQLTGDNADGSTNILTRMNIDMLKGGYLNLLHHIYSPRHYYARVKTFLMNYEPGQLPAKLRAADIKPFLRSVVRLGVIGRERFEYWKLLLWTFFHRRRSFPQAIRLMIYGFHFRKVADHHVH